MEAKKLEKLLISEVSGVDRPANMLDGWMIQKSVDGEAAAQEQDETSLIGKIRALLATGSTNAGKDDISMTTEELAKELDDRFAAFGETLNERLTKATEDAATAAAAAAAATAPEAETAPETAAVTIEDVTKAIEAGLEAAIAPVLEICDKALDRIAGLEKGSVTRKSIDGQENGLETEEQPTPTVGDAIAKAFSR